MVTTQRGVDCPICLQNGTDPPGKTAYVALIPYAAGEGQSLRIVQPHSYAVCRGCYLDQFVQVYPDADPPDLPVMPTPGKSEKKAPNGSVEVSASGD